MCPVSDERKDETMEEATKEQIERLPKWAQRHIERLENAVQSAENELRANIEDMAGTGLRLYARGYLSQPRGISNDALLEWGEGRNRVRVGLRRSGDRVVLEVQGDGTLRIQPRSSNLFYVETKEV